MPEITLHKTPQDKLWVNSIMRFPNAPDLRDQYYSVHLALEELKIPNTDDSLEVAITVKTLRSLVNAPPHEELKKLTSNAIKQGVIAGDILATIYLMDRFKLPEPSMNKAIHVAMEFAKNNKYGDGSKLNTTEKKIREYWNNYKSVSHLWAAHRLGQVYPYAQDNDPEAFPKFLSCAAGLAEFAFEYFLPRTTRRLRGTILENSEIWTLPKWVPASHLVTNRPPDLLLKYLETYAAD
jgi:hypothetical protein